MLRHQISWIFHPPTAVARCSSWNHNYSPRVGLANYTRCFIVVQVFKRWRGACFVLCTIDQANGRSCQPRLVPVWINWQTEIVIGTAWMGVVTPANDPCVHRFCVPRWARRPAPACVDIAMGHRWRFRMFVQLLCNWWFECLQTTCTQIQFKCFYKILAFSY